MNTLIDNYLYNVGKHLPSQQKKDILDELKANIYDQLEASNALNNDKAAEQLLLELGPPAEVARSYTQETRHLIGPELLDIYWTVVKWVLLGVSIAYSVIGVVKIATADFTVSNITQAIIQFLAQTWQSGLSIFGTITLIFILVYHNLRESDEYKNSLPNKEDDSWNIEALKKLSAPLHSKDIVQKSGPIGSIIGTIVGFLLLNALAYGFDSNLWIAYTLSGIREGAIETSSFGALNQSLLRDWMLIINLCFAGTFVLDVYLLIQNKWQTKTRIASIVLEVAGLVVFLSLWLNPDFINWSKAASILSPDTLNAFNTSMGITRTIVAAVVTGITVFTLYDHVHKMFIKE